MSGGGNVLLLMVRGGEGAGMMLAVMTRVARVQVVVVVMVVVVRMKSIPGVGFRDSTIRSSCCLGSICTRCVSDQPSVLVVVFGFYIDRRCFKRAHSGTFQSAALSARGSRQTRGTKKPRCLPNTC